MVELTEQIWVPKRPMHHVFFDVDSTLSAIEGIDVLAEWNQVGSKVAAITEQCMSKTGMNPEAYQQRLEMVKPTINQINRLSELYIKELTTGASEVIAILHKLDKQIYIVSAGIKQALLSLADYLSIPPNHIHAVDVFFDAEGHYHHFDHTSLLAQNDGKTRVIQQTCPSTKSAFLIGDGLSDLDAYSAVNRFVGFGGHCIRPNVQNASEYYISSPHLYALLPLLLTASEANRLNQDDYNQYALGLEAIFNKQVRIKESGNVQN